MSAEELRQAGVDPALLTLLLWTETLRDMAEKGGGNTIFLDGNLAAITHEHHRPPRRRQLTRCLSFRAGRRTAAARPPCNEAVDRLGHLRPVRPAWIASLP